VPAIGPERLEIQLVEVATAARGRKIGTEVVQMLAERNRDRRLFAYSQDADIFWGLTQIRNGPGKHHRGVHR